MGNTFFERFYELCKERGETPNSVARIIGGSSGSVTAWKKGTVPRGVTLTKLADYFNVSVDYLMGDTGEEEQKYYFDEESARIAQRICENPGLRILFDAAEDVPPKDLEVVADMIKRLKRTNSEE